MEYGVAHTNDVPVTDLSEIDELPPDLDIRAIDEALGLDQMNAKLWYLDPGEQIGYHAHSEQEEFYYVIQGEFSLKLGKSGEEEIREAGPGTFFAAGPEIGHGYRNVGDETGLVLAIGSPPVEDPGLDPHQLD
ncbi:MULTISPECIES: cupin domain-containing protein [unclassified Haladaptatus]|uniref:cupin domain-containing protein n=2 Tax=Haladaptatus TaxID=367188 RepID=UPI0023E8E359|nr:MULTISPECIES: cupin domain-containing protein [unclassified Haladaptatus]